MHVGLAVPASSTAVDLNAPLSRESTVEGQLFYHSDDILVYQARKGVGAVGRPSPRR